MVKASESSSRSRWIRPTRASPLSPAPSGRRGARSQPLVRPHGEGQRELLAPPVAPPHTRLASVSPRRRPAPAPRAAGGTSPRAPRPAAAAAPASARACLQGRRGPGRRAPGAQGNNLSHLCPRCRGRRPLSRLPSGIRQRQRRRWERGQSAAGPRASAPACLARRWGPVDLAILGPTPTARPPPSPPACGRCRRQSCAPGTPQTLSPSRQTKGSHFSNLVHHQDLSQE
jgi:hypothetical protein